MGDYYVYIYYDPLFDNEPMYVGKGKGNRFASHLKRVDCHPFTERLAVLEMRGVKPKIGIYAGMTESAAFQLEAELVSEIGRRNVGTGPLYNLIPGGKGRVRDPNHKTQAELEKIEIDAYIESLAAKRRLHPRLHIVPKEKPKKEPKRLVGLAYYRAKQRLLAQVAQSESFS